MKTVSQRSSAFLVSILLIGSAVWLSRGIVSQPLWADEGWSLYVSQLPTLSDLFGYVKADLHPPLYYLFLRGWAALVGLELAALRLPAVWSALLTLALTYRLAVELFNQRAAFAALVIVATSDLVFSMTPTVRHYAPFMGLAALSTWAYWRSMQRFMRRDAIHPVPAQWLNGWLLLYCLSSLALIYTMYWGGLILLAQGFHALLYHRRHVPKLLLIAAVVELGYLPWLSVFLSRLTSGGVGANTNDSGYTAALRVDWDGMKVILFQLFGIPEALFVGLALAGLAGSLAARRCSPTRQTMLVGSWLILPLLLPIASGLLGYNLLTHRPLIAMVPPMAILVGHVLSQFQGWQYALLLGIIVVNNLVSTGAEPPPRGPWWEVGDFLGNHLSPQDALLIESDIYAYTIEEHAKLADAPFAAVIRGEQIREGWHGETATEVNPLLAAYDSLWLVEFTNHYDIKGELGLLGFAQTTPTLDFGFFLVDTIHLTRFARPSAAEPQWVFGGDLGLRQVNSFQHSSRLRVDMTWSVANVPVQDFTISVFLLAEDGRLAAQHDSFPLDGNSPTTTWLPHHFYFDRANLDLSGVPNGEYQLGIKVYFWAGLRPLPVTPCAAAACEYALVETIRLR